jgi:hypothetical protein
MEDEPQKGRGRPPAHVHRANLARLESLIVEGYSIEQCIEIVIADGRTDNEDTVRRWRAEVFARWTKEDIELRPARRDMMRQQLMMLFRASYQASTDTEGRPLTTMAATLSRAECTKIAKLSCQLDGLLAPTVVKVDAAVDPLSMSPSERRAEIDELLAKREAAMREAAGRDGN